jgi:outer membrane protein TolC
MNRKKYILLVPIFIVCQWAFSQAPLTTLSLHEAYTLLEERYPALKDTDVLTALHQKEQEKLDKVRLPGIYLKADGRLQSESPSLNLPDGVSLPFEIDLPLYAVKTFIEAQYNIIDGGMNEVQKNLKEIQLKSDLQEVEVNKYALRKRINQLFVNIAILREQITVFDISLKDLNERTQTLEAAVEEGVALESELTKIKVKELEINSQKDNISYSISGLINSLSQLLNVSLNEDVVLNFPSYADPLQIPNIVRPEQELFKLKQNALMANYEMIDARRKPKVAAFAQAGIGYPNPLNFLDNEFTPYGIIGFQFNWKITDWKADLIEKEILSLQAKRIQNAHETFDFNLATREAGYLADIERLQNQINKEKEIADLQGEILAQLAIQLDEGIITSADYITQVNAELRSRQNILIRQTELLKRQIEFWNERGY